MRKKYDVVVVGAGAAGLMAAATAAKRGRTVLLIEATDKIGEKIRISGGGRCNFTNIYASPSNYISENKHFVKSALTKYTQQDFINMVEQYGISYHEKTLGQLFCDHSSSQIVNMLLSECRKYAVEMVLGSSISEVKKDISFFIRHSKGMCYAESLIIATGGLSIPKLGASDFGYRVASQFGMKIVPTRPALVPLTVKKECLEFCRELSGVSINSVVSYKGISFKENMLFTHKGLSGPAILQISSYIDDYKDIELYIDLLPEISLKDHLLEARSSKLYVQNILKKHLPNRFVENLCKDKDFSKRLIEYKIKDLEAIASLLHKFSLDVDGTEGYAKAEVTAGGVDTTGLSSKTMSSISVPNLYFIGEVVDVTGWLGGYNFQWAWSSGFAAGSYA